jgi:F0F1-type ATP synthase assembly protein I
MNDKQKAERTYRYSQGWYHASIFLCGFLVGVLIGFVVFTVGVWL